MLTDCPKCTQRGFLASATDEYHQPDPSCIYCGFRPSRPPTDEERVPELIGETRRPPTLAGQRL